MLRSMGGVSKLIILPCELLFFVEEFIIYIKFNLFSLFDNYSNNVYMYNKILHKYIQNLYKQISLCVAENTYE